MYSRERCRAIEHRKAGACERKKEREVNVYVSTDATYRGSDRTDAPYFPPTACSLLYIHEVVVEGRETRMPKHLARCVPYWGERKIRRTSDDRGREKTEESVRLCRERRKRRVGFLHIKGSEENFSEESRSDLECGRKKVLTI